MLGEALRRVGVDILTWLAWLGVAGVLSAAWWLLVRRANRRR